ncbi:uncharacterized protein LOC111144534 isoform X2 [Enhydra lutris kenyoni]|uniref:Uncharacterized protein LOC111144534 isoform X2 n=1 Tax=Enhydra lutris kenyoni TaxID=391180 RepID=A0A2Y9J4B3_ENHLU|nr:uncharacterized protein LOC111144534 isoform X2 [Enhydra lutris kenyoni]
MPSTDRDREDVVHGRSGGGLRHQKGRSPAVCIDTGPGEVGQFWTRLVVFCERCPSQGARLLGSSVWPRGIPVMARELVFCVSGGRTCWDMVSLCVEVQDSFWEWTHQLLSPPTAVRLQAPPGPGPCRPVSLEPFCAPAVPAPCATASVLAVPTGEDICPSTLGCFCAPSSC